jgi:hypothetical protein
MLPGFRKMANSRSWFGPRGFARVTKWEWEGSSAASDDSLILKFRLPDTAARADGSAAGERDFRRDRLRQADHGTDRRAPQLPYPKKTATRSQFDLTSLIEIPRKRRPKRSDPVIMRFCFPQTKIKSLSMTSSSGCFGLTFIRPITSPNRVFMSDTIESDANRPPDQALDLLRKTKYG